MSRRPFEASLPRKGGEFFTIRRCHSAGGSERRLGELAERKNVVIATKFRSHQWGALKICPTHSRSSLKNLGAARSTLYQHHFSSPRVDIATLMGLMADAVEAGKAKAVGVSNYSAAQMRTAYEALAQRGIPLASNQVQYSCCTGNPESNGVQIGHLP